MLTSAPNTTVQNTEGGDKPILLFANPMSRGGRAARRIERARELMDSYGLNHVFRSTLPDGQTMELVSKSISQEGFRTLVYLGGDGTFNEVAKGICQSGNARSVRLGMLPSGTANDQGKSFGIRSSPRSLRRNIQIIAAGHTTTLDVGELTAMTDTGTVVRRDLFFDSMGWGLSAAILAFRNRELKILKKVPVVRDMYRDQMIYVRAAMRELALGWLTQDLFVAELTVDGQSHTLDNLTDLVINTIVYAGEWVVDPKSLHNDGRFEIVPFSGVRDWTSKLILYHKKSPITEEMLNKIGVSHTPSYRGSDIRLQLYRPNRDKSIPAQLDGEEFPPADRFEIQVHPQFLNIIVPKDFHWV
jgi:diacylglycerol kinase family enzyme